MFFLCDNSSSVSSENIKNIITKSSIGEFKFKSYVQDDTNGWRVQNIIND